jgi:hypothetical protein
MLGNPSIGSYGPGPDRPSVEGLRYAIDGEWGKLLGLDRIPEVRKVAPKNHPSLLTGGLGERWSSQLALPWMADSAQSAGVLITPTVM